LEQTLKERAKVHITSGVDMMTIPSECAKSYICTTGKCLGSVSVREHQRTLKKELLEISKVAQHAHNGGHCVKQESRQILQTESSFVCMNSPT
jgi:hypothetical protein